MLEQHLATFQSCLLCSIAAAFLGCDQGPLAVYASTNLPLTASMEEYCRMFCDAGGYKLGEIVPLGFSVKRVEGQQGVRQEALLELSYIDESNQLGYVVLVIADEGSSTWRESNGPSHRHFKGRPEPKDVAALINESSFGHREFFGRQVILVLLAPALVECDELKSVERTSKEAESRLSEWVLRSGIKRSDLPPGRR